MPATSAITRMAMPVILVFCASMIMGTRMTRIDGSAHPIRVAVSIPSDPTKEAITSEMSPGAYPAPPLPQSWVWVQNGKSGVQGGVGCFRKAIDLLAAPRKVEVWASADRHYRLFVNGVIVSRGPTDPGEDYPGGKSKGNTGIYYCDYIDLTRFFHKGKNVIAVEVFAEQLSSWYGSSGHPGLLLQARITQSDRTVAVMQADETWRGRSGDYLNSAADGVHYFPSKEPRGWLTSEFDDSTWAICAKIESFWPAVQTSQLPPLRVVAYAMKRIARAGANVSVPSGPFQKGQTITLKADGSLAIQYDRVLSAYVRFKIRGSAGAELHIGLNEADAPGGHRSATIHLIDGDQVFETPFYSSFTFINLTANHVAKPVEILDVSAEFVSYPVEQRGSFSCSDNHLSTLWSASRWAAQLCMQDHYLDSPDHQEPICDPGDYMIEALLNDYAFGEQALTRQELRKFGALLSTNNYICFHTSYSLLWLQMLIDYYDYTGDASLVRELSPVVFGLMDRFATWRGKNGLISEAPDYMFMDWVDIAGIGCHHPPAVIGQGYLTAFYYRALTDAGRVADVVGDKGRSGAYAAWKPQILAAFNRELWSPMRTLYRDGKPFQTAIKPGRWLPADTDIETFSPHVNTLAVLFDLAPKDRQPEIISRIMRQSPLNCQPYFYHFVFNAMAHCGVFDNLASEEMQRWQINPVTGTFREMWTNGDWSHAWGGTPLYQLSSKVLGVTPKSPGYGSVSIRPTLCDLWWAKGSVPTPHGNVDISWQRTENGMQLDVTVPPGSSADVELPLYRFSNPRVTYSWQQKAGKATALPASGAVHVSSGSWRFTLIDAP